MATLVLGTVGRIYGGPLGAIIGTVVGGAIDRSVLGSGGARDVGRAGNLAIQSAAYGEPIPIITGRMRAAGNLIWTSGIAESSARSGSGKGSGSATNVYSYSASIAVGLAARQIVGISRIWADGKLIRDGMGTFLSPITMRLHHGGDDQAADPLIAAFEGAAGTPAYRGIAYAVFEDLPLEDYGNRIPNLTFEVVADAGAYHDAGQAIATLAAFDGQQIASVEGAFPTIAGYFAGRSGSVADAMAPLVTLADAVLSSDGALVVRGDGATPINIEAQDAQARGFGEVRALERQRLQGGETRLGAVELAFYDTSRDYQPGLQRARRDEAGAVDQQSIACAMTPDQAKTVATAALARAAAARLRSAVCLPWRHLALQPGQRIVMSDSNGTIWRIRQARFENFVVHLDLERIEAGPAVAVTADGGRALAFDDQAAGPTTIVVLDLPPLPGDAPTGPRLWIAAAGASPGWRRSGIEVSGDGGTSYAAIGVIQGGTIQGTSLTTLGPANTCGWDRFCVLDVELLGDAMWLEARSEAAVLAGANLALIGDEIVQFAAVAALGPRQFRLSGLLRGRRGTEAAVSNHMSGERFVVLDPAALLAFDPPIEALGREYRFRAAGIGDQAALPLSMVATGAALAPLSPAHLRLVGEDGAVLASWIRRSRAGFGWPDFVDAPLGEAIEAYRVEILLDGRAARQATVTDSTFVYAIADRLADGNGTIVEVRVAQLSATIGPGSAATATITLA